MKIDVSALNFARSFSLVLLGPAKTSLMPWLSGNGFIKRAGLFVPSTYLSQKYN